MLDYESPIEKTLAGKKHYCLELIVVAGKLEATMSKPKKSSEQLVEIENLIANYQKQLRIVQVEILKLELKKEKLRDQIILQSVKSEIAIKRDLGKISSYQSSVFK